MKRFLPLAASACLLLTASTMEAATTKKKSPVTGKRKARPAPKVSPRQKAEAQTMVSEWVQRSIPIENPEALSAFFTRLQEARESNVRVLQYGDSHTAADSFSGAVRSALQQEFGDGGLGFGFTGRPFAGYRRLGSPAAASKKWKVEGLTKGTGEGPFGLGGVTVTTSLPGQTVSLRTSCKRFELQFLRQPGAGRVAISVDGVAQATVDTSGAPGAGSAAVEVADGEHVFEVRTLDRRPVRLWGWVTDRPVGITYENLGINGAQAGIVSMWDEAAHVSQLQQRAPALVVLAYGTNESGVPDWTADGYYSLLTSAVARIRKALPHASVLLLGPPDRAARKKGNWVALDRLDRITEIQRRVAREQNAAFWDQRDQMGGSGSMHTWYLAGLAQRDHVHFTEAGYAQLGRLFYSQLIEQRTRQTDTSSTAQQGLALHGQIPENHRNPPTGHQ